MSKWEMVKLGKVATFVNGYAFKPSDWGSEGLPIIRIQNLASASSIFNYYIGKYQEKYEINAGDVLISWSASLGVYKWEKEKALLNQHIFKVVFNKLKIEKDYFIYATRFLVNKMLEETHGSTMQHITKKRFDNIQFPLPPFEVQRKIAQTLDAAAALLALRKQQLAALDNLIKSVFYEMFGDPVTNEKGWDVKCLGSITQIATGGTPSRACEDYYSGGTIPWIKTGEVHGSYITSVEERITALAVKETNCKIMPRNTILIAMYGQGKTRGQVGMLQIDGATNQACAAILPNGDFSSEYLFRLLNINYQTLRDLGRGGNQPNLNLNIVKKFPVLFPPVYIQTQFAEIVTKIEEQKVLVQKAIDESQYLFDSLMNEYFN